MEGSRAADGMSRGKGRGLGDRSSSWERPMGVCETCRNEYDKTFDIVKNGERHTFDSFECAIYALAPKCAQCSCRIIGNGVEADGAIYCCAHCAKRAGVKNVRDRG